MNKENKIYELKRKNELLFAWVLFVSAIAIFLLVLVFYAMDNVDIDDVLAPLMCDGYDMDVASVEYYSIGFGVGYTEDSKLHIRCKRRANTTEIEDGYLLEVEE